MKRTSETRLGRGLVFFAHILTLGAAAPCLAAVLAGPIVNPSNGHAYYLLSQNDWTSSEAEAVTLGGHLVTIDDATENLWVFDTFSTFGGTNRALWIGCNDLANEGTFVWSSGGSPQTTLWSHGQPDNGFPGPDPPGEDFVHMLWPTHPNASEWNDFQNLSNVNGFNLYGVVEVVPPVIFADGFELGDTFAWSSTVPPPV